MIVIVMGVSGAGKSTVGAMLAAALGAAFIDGDDAHPKANIDKMRRGAPLDDADRLPWLRDLAGRLDASRTAGGEGEDRTDVVLACSALKARYRDVLTEGRMDVRIVHLTGEAAVLRRRVEARTGHFMPAGLLASQLADLEAPMEAIEVDAALAPEEIVAAVLDALHDTGSRPGKDGKG
jgi:gluconokinase